MPRKTEKKMDQSKENSSERTYTTVQSLSIDRVKDMGKYAFADLTINGIKVYGCKVVTYEKDGVEKDFLAFPERKYTDKEGQTAYAKIVYAHLSASDEQAICDAVWRAIK